MKLFSAFLRFGLLFALFVMISPLVMAGSQSDEDARMRKKLKLFGDVLALVKDDYVETIEDDKLITGALNGALESLDPHSHYVPPVQYKERQETVRREYGGLGIEVVMDEGLVRVNYVTPDGPAYKSGLKAGDKITAVNGKNILGKTLNEAVEGMRGLAGDPINITVLTKANTQKQMTIVRAKVQGRAIRHRVEDGLGYIYIETFNNPNLDRDVKTAIDLLKEELGSDIPGLIIDVRGNPGGLVDQVVKVTSYFLDGGEVFSARGRTTENTQRYNAKDGELLPDTPIAVLINSRSASAAEIIAGALQDRNRAMIIGRRSFGKGSVQSVIQLDEGGALRLTTQRYYTPSGKSIQSHGIMPDHLVAVSSNKEMAEKRFRENDLANALNNPDGQDVEENFTAMDFPPDDWDKTEDYQLSRAVELLKSPDYKQKLADRNLLQ